MNNVVLKAEKRDPSAKLSEIRNSSFVPGVVYGKKNESVALKVDRSQLNKIFKEVGESHIFSLDLDSKKIDVLIHDFQKDPVKGDFLHMDFYAVTQGQALTTNIKLNFIGKSEAEKEGAIVEEYIRDVEATLLPKDLVDSIDVDISVLKKIGDSIRIKDLPIDTSKITLTHGPEDLIAIASEPKRVEIEDTAPEAVEVPVAGEEEKKEEA
ncbi:50S ribosomal protein L25 [Candidatus Gracilibacteria bacterium]|nr:MAG: 50S ribosomal protein L25 [Candidatus Gracilibacteria bacterium]